LIAVSFDPSGNDNAAILVGALAPAKAAVTPPGSFRIAHTLPATDGASGSVRCVLEGELFNRAELSRALSLRVEIEPAALVARAFSLWDLAAFERLRGSFAVALWDAERRRGILATDHFALCPWYVARTDPRMLAATSMRALLRMLPAAPEPDPITVITWLANVTAPGSGTFARGVERLPGAHAIACEDGRVTKRRFWQPGYREPLRAPRNELTEELRMALGDAVRRRTPPGETTGVILSGGFDSSAVAAVAAGERAAPSQVRTYSAGFPDDPEIDESARVRDLVAARELPSYRIQVAPVGNVRLALAHQRDWGIPSGGPGYLLERALLEQAARDGAVGILDGQGGDELFGFSPYLIADRVRRGRLRAAVQLLASMPDQHGLPPRNALPYCVREYVVRPLLPAGIEWRVWRRGDAGRHLPEWLRRDQLEAFLQADARMVWKQAGAGPLWWRDRVHQLTTSSGGLAEYIAHRARDLGLRMRPPLLDVELVELALRIPPELGYGGINRSLARDSVAGDVPDSVRLAARKSNLQPFYHRALTGPDLAPIRLLLESPDARIYRYADRACMLDLLRHPTPAGQPGWEDWIAPVWTSLTAEIALRSLEDAGFCQRFIDAHDPPSGHHAAIP